MEDPKVKIPLEEGKYYPFKITGSVVLPDGSDCLILSDVNGVKHLLYHEYYLSYNLKLNQEVRCRIDKINCTGKIFIEPEHPFYKLGQTYSFVFDRYIELENADGEIEKLAVLLNGYREDIYLSADWVEKPFIPGEKVTAVVEKIKKGRVYINVGTVVNDYTGLEGGKKYRFTLAGQITMGGKYTYYVLKDEQNREFRIRKKFYEKYGFKKGELITCELVESDHSVFLEPVHPHYEIGFKYEFRIIGETSIKEYPDTHVDAYLLENNYGKEIVVKKADSDPGLSIGDTIHCTVSSIKKSQVSLAC